MNKQVGIIHSWIYDFDDEHIQLCTITGNIEELITIARNKISGADLVKGMYVTWRIFSDDKGNTSSHFEVDDSKIK